MSCAAIKIANAFLGSKPQEYYQKTPLFYLDSWRCNKQQIIETLFSNGATSRDETIYTRPPPFYSNLGVFVARTAAQHCMVGVGDTAAILN